MALNNISKHDFEQICRLCLQRATHENLLCSLFRSNKQNLPSIIMECFGFQVSTSNIYSIYLYKLY